jgi:UDP-N-acetylglucosamine 2-epimerase (non-hydrolysing)
MKKIFLVAGARPNFVKIAPILRELKKSSLLQGVVVHTGQHYDQSMSGSFFDSLGIGEPTFNLGVGSGSHALQTAKIMTGFEDICQKENPDMVLVVGDVNSTIAAGLVAKKLNIPLCHVEAGLRSRDRTMPEEINRLATDAISDLFFTTEKEGTENLLAEGQDPANVHFVGHVMIDNLFYELSKMKNTTPSDLALSIKKRLPAKYLCMTMHRPSNVDYKETLERLLCAIKELSSLAPVVFPCHPRTMKNIEQFGMLSQLLLFENTQEYITEGIYSMPPLGYSDFLYLWKDACLMLTDSGGLQEETTALKIPCITMRENTERPITVEVGSNVLVGTDADTIITLGKNAISGEWKKSSIPDLWDGYASERITDILHRTIFDK